MSKVGADDYIRRARATAADLSALPREELWPVLAPEALYGLAGRIVKTIDPFTEADPVGVLAHVLAPVGNILGPNPHAVVLHDEHPLRFNVALVGRTSKGRKGTSWSTPRYLLAQVDPEWAKTRIVSGLSSGEGLVHKVRDPRWKKEKNGETVLIDEGEPDKRLLVIEPEFAVTLKTIARETNTLSGVMRQAWDSGDLSTLTKNSPERATGAHITIVAHITEEELRRYLNETERANGFANRFLWLMVRRSKCLPEGARVPDELLTPLVAELRQVVAFARQLGEITRDDEAKTIWARVYPQLSDGKPGLFGAVISRAEAQVLRLSAIYAVLDQSTVIRPPHLEAALAVWDCAESSARRIFGDRLGSPLADMILDALRAQGPMTRTNLDRLFQGHKPAEAIQQALATLERRGLARGRQESTPGRAAVVWEAV